MRDERLIDGALASRRIADGRIVALLPLFGDRARITIGNDLWGYDRFW